MLSGSWIMLGFLFNDNMRVDLLDICSTFVHIGLIRHLYSCDQIAELLIVTYESSLSLTLPQPYYDEAGSISMLINAR